MNLKTRTMEMIAFESDGTKETTVKIIKTLKQLGGEDRLNLETNITTTKNLMVGIVVKNLYYFISEISGVIHCDTVLPDEYILSDIDIFISNGYVDFDENIDDDSYINYIVSDNLPTSYDEYPIIVQSLVDKKAETNNTIDLDAYANGAQDCFNAINQLGIYTEADVVKLLIDFKNHIGLLRGIQVLDSDIKKFIESKIK